MSIWQDIKWQLRYGSPLVKIIFVNAIVFIFTGILSLVDKFGGSRLTQTFFDFFSMWNPYQKFLWHPWGIITNMFLHVDFSHVLWNMVALYMFGRIVIEFIGKPKFLPIFLYGGIIGNICAMIFYYIFLKISPDLALESGVGASAGVMAIMLAAITLTPNYELVFFLVGPVKIKWVGLVYVILDIIYIQTSNSGGHIAHLGGAAMGWFYIQQLRNGNDLGRPLYAIEDFFARLFKKKDTLKVEYKKEYAYTNKQDSKQHTYTNNTDTSSKQEKLDAILDKINRSSYDSLSKEEKDFLFKISQED